MKKTCAAILVLAGMSLGGCAGTTVGPDDDSVDGIRYYETAPFMLVYPDGKGGLVSELQYLPDTTRLRVIKPYAYLASNDLTLAFKNGVLTQAVSVVDETAVPKKVVGALKTAAAAAVGMLNIAGGGRSITGSVPPPVLLRVVHDPDGEWRLVGARDGKEAGYGLNPAGTARMDVKVTQSQPPKPEPPARPKTGG